MVRWIKLLTHQGLKKKIEDRLGLGKAGKEDPNVIRNIMAEEKINPRNNHGSTSQAIQVAEATLPSILDRNRLH